MEARRFAYWLIRVGVVFALVSLFLQVSWPAWIQLVLIGSKTSGALGPLPMSLAALYIVAALLVLIGLVLVGVGARASAETKTE